MLTNKGPNGQGEYHTFVIEHNDFIEISLFIEKEFVVKPNVSTFKLPDNIKVSENIELNGLGLDSNGKYFTSFFYVENNLIKTTHTANVKFAYFHGIGKKN